MEQRLRVATDQGQRRPQLVADRRDEPLAELLERADGAHVAQDRGRPGGHATGRRGVAAGDPHRMRRPRRRPPSRDRRSARRSREPPRAGRRAPRAPPATSQPSTSRTFGRRRRRGHPEQALAGRVEPDDQAVGVHLDDQVRRAVDDGLELVALLLERLSQAGPGEGDGELVAGELRDPEAVLVEGTVLGRPDDERRVCGGSSDRIRARAPVVAAGPDRGRGRPACRRASPARSPARASEARPAAVAEPERPAGRIGQPDSSDSTAAARSARLPPDAMSWLSWYWANSASASRWASSKARRRSRSRASTRASSVVAVGHGGRRRVTAHERRSSSTQETAPGSR